MAYFPLFLSLEGKPILITGAGKAAWIKVQAMEPFHPRIMILAPHCLPELLEKEGVEWISGWSQEDFDCLERSDFLETLHPSRKRQLEQLVRTSVLVIQASGSRGVSRNLQHLCETYHTLFNAVDQPDLCDVIFPTLIQAGKLCLGISTSGASPTAAKWLKQTLAHNIPDYFPLLLDFLSQTRPWILDHVHPESLRRQVFSSLFELGLQVKGVPDTTALRAWIGLLEKEYLEQESIEDDPSHPKAGFVSLHGAFQSLLSQCIQVSRAVRKEPVHERLESAGPDREENADPMVLLTSHPGQQTSLPFGSWANEPDLWHSAGDAHLEAQGFVWIAGAGCGARDWLTLQVRKLLETCTVLVYDDLIGADILELAKDCQKIYVGKRMGKHSWKQEDINALLCDLGAGHHRVLRLKGGDPFVFGRGMEEVQALRSHRIPYAVAPGLSSSLAVPLRMEIPLTHRGLSTGWMTVTYGRKKDPASLQGWQRDVASMAAFDGTIVILMGASHIETIAADLIQAGKDPRTPAALISSPDIVSSQMVSGPLDTLADQARTAALPQPGLIVIGPVVTMAKEPAIPLSLDPAALRCAGTIGFAGTRRLFERLGRKLGPQWHLQFLVEGKPKAIEQPAERGEKRDRRSSPWILELCSMLDHANSLEQQKRPVLAFTSPHGASFFLLALSSASVDIRRLWNARIACVGPATGEVFCRHGMIPDLMPDIYTTRDLARKIREESTPETPIVLFRSVLADTAMETVLYGYNWQRVDLYSTNYAPVSPKALDSAWPADDVLSADGESGMAPFWQEWKQRSQACQGIVVGSCASAESWLDACRHSGLDPHAFWYAVLSDVTGNYLQQNGLTSIYTARRADVSDLAACLGQIMETDSPASDHGPAQTPSSSSMA